jgi:hypothetical protein
MLVRLHFLAYSDRKQVPIERYIALPQDVTAGHRFVEFHGVSEADREGIFGEAASGRDELAVHGVTAFAVEHLAGGKVALGHRDGIAAPGTQASFRKMSRRACGF